LTVKALASDTDSGQAGWPGSSQQL